MLDPVRPGTVSRMPVDQRFGPLIAAWKDAWNEGNVDSLDQIMMPRYVRHEGGASAVGLAEHKQRIVELREAFPDLVSTVDDIFGDGDRIAIRWTSVGTQQGEYLGLPPTGRTVTTSGISIARIEAGKITEEWVTWDPHQVLADLGVVQLTRAK